MAGSPRGRLFLKVRETGCLSSGNPQSRHPDPPPLPSWDRWALHITQSRGRLSGAVWVDGSQDWSLARPQGYKLGQAVKEGHVLTGGFPSLPLKFPTRERFALGGHWQSGGMLVTVLLASSGWRTGSYSISTGPCRPSPQKIIQPFISFL